MCFCLLQSPVSSRRCLAGPGCDCPKEPEGCVAELGPHLPRDSRQGNQPALRIALGTIGWRRRETSSLAPEQLLLPKSWDCRQHTSGNRRAPAFYKRSSCSGRWSYRRPGEAVSTSETVSHRYSDTPIRLCAWTL